MIICRQLQIYNIFSGFVWFWWQLTPYPWPLSSQNQGKKLQAGINGWRGESRGEGASPSLQFSPLSNIIKMEREGQTV
jgi:hypothetical protein